MSEFVIQYVNKLKHWFDKSKGSTPNARGETLIRGWDCISDMCSLK